MSNSAAPTRSSTSWSDGNCRKHYGQSPQCIPDDAALLEGLDGTNKMSNPGNYIGINEPAREIFGKVMSISDELMCGVTTTSCPPGPTVTWPG